MQAIGLILVVLGLFWSVIGLSLGCDALRANLGVPGSATRIAAALALNAVTFVLPGVVVVVVGFEVHGKAKLRKAYAEMNEILRAKAPWKTCPFCAERIKGVAIVCRYCGRKMPKAHRRAPSLNE